MRNFKRGDKVVCIEGFTSVQKPVVVLEGWEYTVDYCTGCTVLLVEFPDFTFTPDRFKLADTRHIHHDMIVEWATNPSRVVKMREGDNTWMITLHPLWSKNLQYRFVDTVIPERVFPTTSLSGESLNNLWRATKESHQGSLTAVANAAIKQYILDCEGV